MFWMVVILAQCGHRASILVKCGHSASIPVQRGLRASIPAQCGQRASLPVQCELLHNDDIGSSCIGNKKVVTGSWV